MDLMSIRRGLMAQMAGGRIPSNISIKEFTVGQTATLHQIPHGLNAIPEMFLIIPKVKASGDGASHPYNFMGVTLGGGFSSDYPNRLIESYALTNGNWDYTGSNAGWTADATNIYAYIGVSSRMPAADYVLIAYTYE